MAPQGWKPGSHTIPQAVPSQVAVPFGVLAHGAQAVPQWPTSVSETHPPAHAWKPASHSKPHVPSAQAAVSNGTTGHAVAQEPQWFTSEFVSVSQPSVGSPLQSACPSGHASDTAHRPSMHVPISQSALLMHRSPSCESAHVQSDGFAGTGVEVREQQNAWANEPSGNVVPQGEVSPAGKHRQRPSAHRSPKQQSSRPVHESPMSAHSSGPASRRSPPSVTTSASARAASIPGVPASLSVVLSPQATRQVIAVASATDRAVVVAITYSIRQIAQDGSPPPRHAALCGYSERSKSNWNSVVRAT